MPSGMSLGAPAYAAAGLVGHYRLRADRHYMLDVLAGGAVEALSAWAVARDGRFALRERLASVLTASATAYVNRQRYSAESASFRHLIGHRLDLGERRNAGGEGAPGAG